MKPEQKSERSGARKLDNLNQVKIEQQQQKGYLQKPFCSLAGMYCFACLRIV